MVSVVVNLIISLGCGLVAYKCANKCRFVICVLHCIFDTVVKYLCKLRVLNKNKGVVKYLCCLSEDKTLLFASDVLLASNSSQSIPVPPTIANKDTTRKPTLVLDLDETLIHSSEVEVKNIDYSFRMFDDDHRQYYQIYTRPHLSAFLAVVSQYFEVVIFTASFSCYCDPILDTVDPHHFISKRLYNTSVSLTNQGFEKDLRMASEVNMPRRVVMIDNSPSVCRMHHENLYIINSFRADAANDNDLFVLIPFLVILSSIPDFRAILHRRDRFGTDDAIDDM